MAKHCLMLFLWLGVCLPAVGQVQSPLEDIPTFLRGSFVSVLQGERALSFAVRGENVLEEVGRRLGSRNKDFWILLVNPDLAGNREFLEECLTNTDFRLAVADRECHYLVVNPSFVRNPKALDANVTDLPMALHLSAKGFCLAKFPEMKSVNAVLSWWNRSNQTLLARGYDPGLASGPVCWRDDAFSPLFLEEPPERWRSWRTLLGQERKRLALILLGADSPQSMEFLRWWPRDLRALRRRELGHSIVLADPRFWSTLVRDLDIKRVPALIVFDSDGREIRRLVGRGDCEAWLRGHEDETWREFLADQEYQEQQTDLLGQAEAAPPRPIPPEKLSRHEEWLALWTRLHVGMTRGAVVELLGRPSGNMVFQRDETLDYLIPLEQGKKVTMRRWKVFLNDGLVVAFREYQQE